MADEIQSLSAAAAAAATADGSLDRGELFEHYRARAESDPLNAFTWVAPEAPAVIDGPLGGVPLAVKDLFCTEAIPSQAGSKILEGYCPPYTATAVAKLEAAGAPVLGKTNQDEFAMGSSNENSAYGPVLNPWDLARVPGGSSGGSAAAVAGGLAPWALGTDTGGSIRQPAALCGIVGLKPTYGRVSRFGVVAFASSLEQVGPFARDAEDAAHLLGAIAGDDPMDSTTAPMPVPDYTERFDRGLQGLRVAVPEAFFGDGLDADVRESIERAIEDLAAQGAIIDRSVALPAASAALPVYYIIAPSEASANLARYDGVKYGFSVTDGRSVEDEMAQSRGRGFGAEVKRRIMLGTYALSAGYYDAYYLKAQRVRTLIKREFEAAFATHDVILTPTSPSVAFRLGEKVDDPYAMYLNDLYTIPVNIAGNPAISIPCGMSQGLPVGMQLIGRPFEESTLLGAAHAYGQVTDWHRQAPPSLG